MGAEQVVLFTDLANPVSNAIYQRFGFEPVSDWVTIALSAGVPGRVP
jgi:predicted GNAT family acetyltransferase